MMLMRRQAGKRRSARSKPKKEPMYARITGIAVLDHETRHRMLRMVTDSPGVSFKEIQDDVRLADGPTTWHLEKLHREGFLSLVKDGKTRRYFPRDFPSGLARTITAIREESRRHLLDLIVRKPGQSQAELAHACELAPPTALHHLEMLEGLGLVEAWRDGRAKRYRPTGAAASALGAAT